MPSWRAGPGTCTAVGAAAVAESQRVLVVHRRVGEDVRRQPSETEKVRPIFARVQIFPVVAEIEGEHLTFTSLPEFVEYLGRGESCCVSVQREGCASPVALDRLYEVSFCGVELQGLKLRDRDLLRR